MKTKIKSKKTISIIGTVGVPSCYGGFESLVENLLDYTPDNISYTVYCSAKVYPEQASTYKNASLRYINLSANGISSILYDGLSMFKSLRSDIMLILGVSGCIFLPFIRLIYRGKIITNIDGLEWKRAKWNKTAKCILHLSEKFAVRYSNTVIGDNKGITDYVNQAYHKKAELIEYGADHALPVSKDTYFNDYPFVKNKYAVTVCRIEPENNIAEILQAFNDSKITLPLVMVGNWQKNDYGKKLHNRYKNSADITLLDPVYDTDRINYIRSNAAIYIHGHSAGGTNPSLVEAMNLSLNIVAFDCVYNRETTENKATYWKTPEELTKLIYNYSVIQNGLAMKEIAEKRYQWSIIANKYHELF